MYVSYNIYFKFRPDLKLEIRQLYILPWTTVNLLDRGEIEVVVTGSPRERGGCTDYTSTVLVFIYLILKYIQDHIQYNLQSKTQLAHFSEHLGYLLTEELVPHVTLVNLIWVVAHYHLSFRLCPTQLTDQG